MATRTPSSLSKRNAHAKHWKWAGLLNGDDGTPLALHGFTDRSVQVTGTFGAGGSVDLVGSNDEGVTWVVLTDPQGNALTFTTARLEAISEAVDLVKPLVTAGDGTTSLAMFLFASGSSVP